MPHSSRFRAADSREGAISILSADQLDAELKLSERGAADGRKNIPASDDDRLSAVEQMVVSRIDGAIGQRSNEILGVGSGQDFTTLPQDLEAMASEPQTILTNFRALKARAQSAKSGGPTGSKRRTAPTARRRVKR